MSRLAAAVALLGASCSLRTGTAMYEASPYCTSSFSLVSSTPADGATDVPLGAAITLTFSDFPDPAAAGAVELDAGAKLDAAATVDLVHKAIVIVPRQPLQPGTAHALRFGGLSSLSHVKAPEKSAISFTTGAAPGGGPPPPPAITWSGGAMPLRDRVATTCAPSGCHDATYQSGGLDLSAAASLASLLEKSSEMPSLARVQPGDPASSFVLRKLLGTCDIPGDQMPLQEAPWDPAQNIQDLSDWIAAGAQP